MLNGTWLPQSIEFGGATLPPPENARLIIDGLRYVAEREDARDEGTLVIDLQVVPATVDFVGVTGPNAGKIIPAIFRQRGDLLQFCYEIGDRPSRPKVFNAPLGSDRLAMRYRRVS